MHGKRVWVVAVAHAGIFNGWDFIQWYMVVVCIWCALFVTSQFDFIFMFRNQRFGEVCWHNRHIRLHALPYFMCHCTEYKLSALQVRISEENKLNATTQQFISAKISGCVLKEGGKTHSLLRQSSLQRQNEAALTSYRIRAVEYRKCATGLACWDIIKCLNAYVLKTGQWSMVYCFIWLSQQAEVS